MSSRPSTSRSQAPSTSSKSIKIAHQEVFPSQLPNAVLEGLSLEELYRKAPLTVAAFLFTGEVESERLRERMRNVMLNLDLVRHVQFVEVPVDEREDLRRYHQIDWMKVPTVIIFSKVREITRLLRPLPDALDRSIKYHRFQELKYTVTKPIRFRSQKTLKASAKALVNTARVVLLINGNPRTTWCSNSLRAIDILNTNGVKYHVYNVQVEEGMWHALREIAKFKVAFPHVYLNGRMLGGLPVLLNMMLRETVKSTFNLVRRKSSVRTYVSLSKDL